MQEAKLKAGQMACPTKEHNIVCKCCAGTERKEGKDEYRRVVCNFGWYSGRAHRQAGLITTVRTSSHVNGASHKRLENQTLHAVASFVVFKKGVGSLDAHRGVQRDALAACQSIRQRAKREWRVR